MKTLIQVECLSNKIKNNQNIINFLYTEIKIDKNIECPFTLRISFSF